MDNKSIQFTRIKQLDGLRFIMVCIIVLSHLPFLRYGKVQFVYDTYINNPIMAVDFFFLLSGFGIMYALEGKNTQIANDLKSGAKYAISRMKKIYLLYVFSLIISIPVRALDMGMSHSIAYVAVRCIVDFVFCLPLLQSLTGITELSHMLNGAAWFLSALFISYFVGYFFINRIKKIDSRKNAISCIVLVIGIIMLLSDIALNLDGRFTIKGTSLVFDDFFYSTPYIRCFYLIIGMLLEKSYIIEKNNIPKDTTGREIVILLIAIFYYVSRTSIGAFVPTLLLRLIDIILCTILFFVFASGNGKISQQLAKPVMVKLGNFAMYIFLLHFPATLTIDFIFKTYIAVNGAWIIVLQMILFLLLTVLNIIVYNFISNKLLNKSIFE